ncbi:HNH endonuclease [Thiorhodococcus fuscus]|uniref:HNH endonuclease n=1 Tax=Thiorhodococcus fuscus TaxID=527200 RepID=A0ABW4YEC3_9GAMM
MYTAKKTCYLCSKEIGDENDSREHIIPNSIGGRKKVKGFICIECNSSAGDEWETELAKQLNPLCLFFGIERERGDVPSQTFNTTGNEEYVLHHDGSLGLPRPEYREAAVDSGVEISIKARSMKEARKMLAGVARKHPEVNLEQLLDKAETQSSYCSDMLHMSISLGGANAGRSVVKSALALMALHGISPSVCECANEYLFEEDGKPCFGYYYEKDLVKNRPQGVPFHCVHIEGSPCTREIKAYVEYFAVKRVVMLLSNHYDGEEFELTYAINPQSGTELSIDVDLNELSQQEIAEAYDYKKMPKGSVEEALGKVIQPRMAETVEKHQSEVVEKAVQYAFENCGAKYGERLTRDHLDRVAGLMMEKLEPYLIHILTVPRRKSDV